MFLMLTPNIPIFFTAIPQHIITSPTHCTGYTALLKTIHIHLWWDALPCHYIHPLYRKLGGPQGWSGQVWNILPLPEFDPWTDQSVASHYTDCATPAHKSMNI
jgi:hypothetical protein